VLRPDSEYRVALSGSIRDARGTSLRWTAFSFRTTAEPTKGVRFAALRSLRFRPGTTVGIRIDAEGNVVARRTGVLPTGSWATGAQRAVINGATYYYVLDGIWAGYFVPAASVESTRVRVARPPKPPSPSESEAPSSAPSAQPSNPAPTAPSATPTPSASTPPAATPAPTAAPTPTPVSPPPVTSGSGILMSTDEIRRLPMSGAAWTSLKRTADGSAGSPNLADNEQSNNVNVLAKALVYARTGDARYRTEVVSALRAVMGTENGGDTLALGRELAAYVISADLIGLRTADPALDATFRTWLRGLLDRRLANGLSLTETHERRPNNWGTHAGASRAAAAAYLGDTAELARVAAVFRGWTGDRTAYAGFSYGDLWWQANPAQPVGINPVGATISGRNVDGVVPDDQRRTGEFTWPPPCGNYPHGALDGALLTAEILYRAGYPAYAWGSNGLLRAEQWLQSTGCAPSGDNVWQLPLLDERYGSRFWNGAVVRPGKNFGWTDWLYGS
jgi:hypothetical protein